MYLTDEELKITKKVRDSINQKDFVDKLGKHIEESRAKLKNRHDAQKPTEESLKMRFTI